MIKSNRYYAIMGKNVKGYDIDLPVVTYNGWAKDSKGKVCHSFTNHRSGGRLSFYEGEFVLSDCNWDLL
jgi:hypothetical protein